jgi:hypothetical protein
MSIATELTRISDAKDAIQAAIIAKGVSVSDADLLDAYAAKVAAITGGGAAPNFFGFPVQDLDSVGGQFPDILRYSELDYV